MGTTGHYYGLYAARSGNPSVKVYLDNQNTETNAAGTITWRVLKSVTKGGVYYAAIERIHDYGNERQRDVIAVVQPYHFSGKGEARMLYVKDVDENMGPYHIECPDNILDLLTDALSEEAREWRARCYENNAKKSTKLKVGDVLTFKNGLTFTGYGKVHKFRVLVTGRKTRYVALPDDGNGFPCRLTRFVLKNFDYTVERA